MEGENDMPAMVSAAGSDSLSPRFLYGLAEGMRDVPDTHEWFNGLAYTLAEISDLPEARPVRYRA